MSLLVLHLDPLLVSRIGAFVATTTMNSFDVIVVIIVIINLFDSAIVIILAIGLSVAHRRVLIVIVTLYEVEPSGTNPGLDANESLHTAHGHLGLLPNIVSPDEGLKPNQTSQSAESPSCLQNRTKHSICKTKPNEF